MAVSHQMGGNAGGGGSGTFCPDGGILGRSQLTLQRQEKKERSRAGPHPTPGDRRELFRTDGRQARVLSDDSKIHAPST